MAARHYAATSGENTTVRIDCVSCDRMITLTVPTAGYNAWQAGELIQNALPLMASIDREALITGTCPKCWAKLAPNRSGLPARQRPYAGPFPRPRHSHRCRSCGAAVYCYKGKCTVSQSIETCNYCRPAVR